MADQDQDKDRADAARWRAIVRFWRESDNPTDITNEIASLVETDDDQMEEGMLKG